jgi:hypothetical protein
MPFEGCFARVFNIASVQRDAPACSGVYGLSDAREWIYVGETGNIQGRLMELLQGTSSSAFLRGRTPTGFSFELCHPSNRIARQDRLVYELEPFINRRPSPHKR